MDLNFYSKFNPPPKVQLSIPRDEKIRTKQSFKDECDINGLVARYRRTGQFPMPNKVPQYGDFTSVPDYQTARNLVLQAEHDFLNLPSALRAECDNDPAVFLDRLRDPEFVQKHGLAATPLPAVPDPAGGQPAPSPESSDPAPKA